MGLTVRKIAKFTNRGRYRDANGLYLQVLSVQHRTSYIRDCCLGVRWDHVKGSRA